jgi:hypothetical protein
MLPMRWIGRDATLGCCSDLQIWIAHGAKYRPVLPFKETVLDNQVSFFVYWDRLGSEGIDLIESLAIHDGKSSEVDDGDNVLQSGFSDLMATHEFEPSGIADADLVVSTGSEKQLGRHLLEVAPVAGGKVAR